MLTSGFILNSKIINFVKFAEDLTHMGYLLSIIIPTKNLFSLLERCLASLPRRSDIQIIVVDDSSDMTPEEKAHYPGLNDPGVEVIFTTEAKGAGYARNVALNRAEGKWLMFVDSDDFLTENALQLIDAYADSDNDIVFFGIESRYSDSLEPAWRHQKFEKAFTDYSGLQLESFLRYGYTEPWGKLIRRSLVEEYDIRFDESIVANDYKFSVLTGHYASGVELCRQPLVCVTVREGSLCDDYFGSDEKTLSRLQVYAGVQRFFDENNIRLEPLFRYMRGVRTNRKHLFTVALSQCRNAGYSLFEVIFRCVSGYVRSRMKKDNQFC